MNKIQERLIWDDSCYARPSLGYPTGEVEKHFLGFQNRIRQALQAQVVDLTKIDEPKEESTAEYVVRYWKTHGGTMVLSRAARGIMQAAKEIDQNQPDLSLEDKMNLLLKEIDGKEVFYLTFTALNSSGPLKHIDTNLQFLANLGVEGYYEVENPGSSYPFSPPPGPSLSRRFIHDPFSREVSQFARTKEPVPTREQEEASFINWLKSFLPSRLQSTS